MKKKAIFIFAGVVIYCLSPAVPWATGKTFTLCDEDLMLLDAHLYGIDIDTGLPMDANDPNMPKIVNKRDVPGPGVEFDIYFPKDNKKNNFVKYVSCEYHGEGALVDINVPDYNSFALKFTLIAVDGSSEPNTGGLLVVGALIDSAYRSEVISLMQGESNTAVSVTTVETSKTSIIGFDARKLVPKGWNAKGTTVTVLIESAPDAEVPP